MYQGGSAKSEAVMNWQTPKDVGEIRSFLGLAGYYRRFIQDFSKIASSLIKLTKKNAPFVWGEEQEEAFVTLRRMLRDTQYSVLPDGTEDLVVIVYCDAFISVCGVLMHERQVDDVFVGSVPEDQYGGARIYGYGVSIILNTEYPFSKSIRRIQLMNTAYWKQFTEVIPQVTYQTPPAPTQPMPESPFVDSGFAVLVFSPEDDPIAYINKAMAFLTAVASSRFPSTNNQLRTSSNPRNQATIQDGRVTVQQVQECWE
ncbi:hypothetical protein Tco_0331288 [Tanacetum coccineum]